LTNHRPLQKRFIYVCNATQAAVVNALPIVHAGLDRIAEVVIFCGAPKDIHIPDSRHTREAIEPANHLEAAIIKMACGNGLSVERRYGDAGDSPIGQGTCAQSSKARRPNACP
jgi:hypothetical protein